MASDTKIIKQLEISQLREIKKIIHLTFLICDHFQILKSEYQR